MPELIDSFYSPGVLEGFRGAEAESFDGLFDIFAFGKVKVMSMNRNIIESLAEFEGQVVCHVVQDRLCRGRDILQSLNYQFTQLRNYIYGVNGLY